MTEQITQEWIDNLSATKRKLAKRLCLGFNFLVMGDAMSFIEEVAPACGYNIVCVKLKTLDDLRGTPVVKYDEGLGLCAIMSVLSGMENPLQQRLLRLLA